MCDMNEIYGNEFTEVKKFMSNNKNDINSLLIFAIKNNFLQTFMTLIENPEIDINTQDEDGYTTLHCAVLSGNINIVKLLLEKENIVANSTDNLRGITPLHTAVFCGQSEIVDLLINNEKVDVNAKTKDTGLTALHIAAIIGSEKIVSILLKNNDIKIDLLENTHNYNPAQCAAEAGHMFLAMEISIIGAERSILDSEERNKFFK